MGVDFYGSTSSGCACAVGFCNRPPLPIRSTAGRSGMPPQRDCRRLCLSWRRWRPAGRACTASAAPQPLRMSSPTGRVSPWHACAG